MDFEKYAIEQKDRYSLGAENYCFTRILKAPNKRCKLFWLNMHYLYDLMRTPHPTSLTLKGG